LSIFEYGYLICLPFSVNIVRILDIKKSLENYRKLSPFPYPTIVFIKTVLNASVSKIHYGQRFELNSCNAPILLSLPIGHLLDCASDSPAMLVWIFVCGSLLFLLGLSS
jgi:hypothetical protein